jgi:hypothetical protein
MAWLSSLPAGVLVAGWLAFALGIGLLSRIVIRSVVPIDEHDHVQPIATALMSALGATFAVLMAITLSSEAGYFAIGSGHCEQRSGASVQTCVGSNERRRG